MNIVLVVLLGAAILAIGLWSLSALRREDDPDDDGGPVIPFDRGHHDDD